MAMVQVHVLKPIRVDRLGFVPRGRVVELIEAHAREYMAHGAVELYETKVLRENPAPAVGAQLSASPAVQASRRQTLTVSTSGAPTRRGRPPKVRAQ
jgi:hypothetical protein